MSLTSHCNMPPNDKTFLNNPEVKTRDCAFHVTPRFYNSAKCGVTFRRTLVFLARAIYGKISFILRPKLNALHFET